MFTELPPTAGTLSPWLLLRALLSAKSRSLGVSFGMSLAKLEQGLSEGLELMYPGYQALLTSSGKASLYTLLAYLRAHRGVGRIIVSAYTCPDVVTPALRAGLEVALVDIEPRTMDCSVENLSQLLEWRGQSGLRGQAIVLSNLYGMVDTAVDALYGCNMYGCNMYGGYTGGHCGGNTVVHGSENHSDYADRKTHNSIADNSIADIVVIDDACQAACSVSCGRLIGGRYDYGVFSFGRGKALSGVGGGAVLVKDEFKADLLSSRRHDRVCDRGCDRLDDRCSATLRYSSSSRVVKDVIRGMSYWLAEQPLVFRLLGMLPFLGIGGNPVRENFEVCGASSVEKLYALLKIRGDGILQESQGQMAEKTEHWAKALGSLDLIHPHLERMRLRYSSDSSDSGDSGEFDGSSVQQALIRYPLLFPSKQLRDRAYFALNRAGLGASLSYQAVLADYPLLRGKVGTGEVRGSELPGARKVAERLLTLPVHRYLTPAHQEKTVRILRGVL